MRHAVPKVSIAYLDVHTDRRLMTFRVHCKPMGVRFFTTPSDDSGAAQLLVHDTVPGQPGSVMFQPCDVVTAVDGVSLVGLSPVELEQVILGRAVATTDTRTQRTGTDIVPLAVLVTTLVEAVCGGVKWCEAEIAVSFFVSPCWCVHSAWNN